MLRNNSRALEFEAAKKQQQETCKYAKVPEKELNPIKQNNLFSKLLDALKIKVNWNCLNMDILKETCLI